MALNEPDTISELREGKSLTRLGDGELNLVTKKRQISDMQVFDSGLRTLLLDAIRTHTPGMLVGIPVMPRPPSWVRSFKKRFKGLIKDTPGAQNEFASAFVTRPSVVGRASDEYFKYLQQVWEDRDVVLINFNSEIAEHMLFAQARSRVFIEIPRRDAFAVYEDLAARCRQYYDDSPLFLVSAGPTATCLVRQLVLDGQQGIDIGQIVFEHDKYRFFEGQALEKWTSQGTYRR